MASPATTDRLYCTPHEMALQSRTVREMLTYLCWTMLCYTPRNLKNPHFDQAFPSVEVIEAALLPIVFPDGILGASQSATPPPLSFFKGLPRNSKSQWAVYVIVLEKDNCRPKLYIGSGTSQHGGVMKRLGQYRRQELLPFYVKKALDNGFSITHYGLLCWSPIPDLTRAASLRGLFLVLEAAFTLWFWPIASRTKDYGMPRLFPWDTSTLIHDGCCSHFPLIEGALGLSASLSPEQIAAVKVERRRKAQAWFHTQNRAYRRARDRGPVSRRKRRVLASKKFSCITCGLVFDCAFHKRRHEATKNHRNKAAGQQFKTVTRWTITYAKNRAAKRYYCQPCDYAAGSRTTLKSHCESKAHLQKAGDSFSFPSIMRIKGKTAAKRVADRKITAKENVESKKFYCQPCDYATTDRRNFNRHLRAQKHEDKVTGTVRVPKEPRTEERREQRAAARIAKLHYCEVCDYIAGTQQNLNSHFNTKPHQEKAKSHQKVAG